MDKATKRPIVLLSACRKAADGRSCDGVNRSYLDATIDAVGAIPLMLPTETGAMLDGDLLERVDGVLLTGSVSNVEPHHFSGAPSSPDTAHDPGRDATTLPLVKLALAAGVPLLGICRGFQEMNVALGGTLYQRVQDLPGMMDHREDSTLPVVRQYDLAHDIAIEPGGLLDGLVDDRVQRVNSLHQQGVDLLAPGLVVEARAPDGLVEAFSVAGADAFALAVQWHPEWGIEERPLSQLIFSAFGDACRARSGTRRPR